MSSKFTLWPDKGAVRRWLICAGAAGIIYLFGGRVTVWTWQIGWHLFHHNRLRLSRTEYTVPMRWVVKVSDPTGALLADAPPRIRKVTVVTINSSGPHIDVNRRLQLEQQYWKSDFGQIQRTYRLQSGLGEFACLESTSHVIPNAYVSNCWNASGDWAMLVGDEARLADYYAILASARPIGKQ